MVLDRGSSVIQRVVRSMLAAEAASASTAHDRATLIRFVLSQVVYGQGEATWPEVCRRIPYALLTDCRSLAQRCTKTGSTLTEKRVSLDIADVRAAVDDGACLRWIPTDQMPADGLTKVLCEQPALDRLAWHSRMRVNYSEDDSKRARRLKALGLVAGKG